MPYLGNTPEQQAFTPAVDYFSGNGSTTAFTLSRPVASTAQIQVTVENVPQAPGTAYTVSGNTITFDGAPPSGTNNIYVYYTSPITQVIQPGQGTVGLSQLTATGNASSSTFLRGDNSWQVVAVTPTAVSDQLNASTGYFDLPVGTTAQRPVSPVNGMIRYNTTESKYEVYTGTQWEYVSTSGYPYSVELLLVAGGGGGGSSDGAAYYGGGGGGAGGYLDTTALAAIGTAYSIIVGSGGGGGSGGNRGTSGNNSTGFGQTAIGGGGGGGWNNPNGGSGGSGGGARSSGPGGDGTSGQGNKGGSATETGAGGGGASAAGVNNTSATNGTAGGAGGNWKSLGTFYAGGGGGGSYQGGSSGAGGAGGGGSGGNAGTSNTGGGGGGGNSGQVGQSGGSGIVIIRYLGAQRGTGGTVTSSGGYTYHTFTSSGTYTA